MGRLSPLYCKVVADILHSPIAFYPASVIFNQPNFTELYDLPGVSAIIDGIVDELLELSKKYQCDFPSTFHESVIAQMKGLDASVSVMYQDYLSRRPMEVETYLGAPIRFAKQHGIAMPRTEVLYALLVDKNTKNLNGDGPPSPGRAFMLPPRSTSVLPTGPGARPYVNGMRPNGRPPGGSRAPSLNGPPPHMRRGPPSNGYPPRPINGPMNGYPPWDRSC